MNYDEMRGKQGANLLNHVTSLLGQDEFSFFPLLFNKGFCVLSYCAMLRDQFLAIAGIECSIFFYFT